MIISNVNVLKRKLDIQQDRNVESKRKRSSRKKNAARSVKDKNKRLMLKVEETVKLITNDKLTYTDEMKITLTDICTECILKPRFHTRALEHLLKNNFFHADALKFAENMLVKLNSIHEKESQRRMEHKRRAETNSKQSTLFLEHFQQTKLASVEAESSSPGMSGSASIWSFQMYQIAIPNVPQMLNPAFHLTWNLTEMCILCIDLIITLREDFLDNRETGAQKYRDALRKSTNSVFLEHGGD